MEEHVELFHAELGCLLFIPAIIVTIGEGGDEDATWERLVVIAVNIFGSRHCHRLMGATVETALEDDDDFQIYLPL